MDVLHRPTSLKEGFAPWALTHSTLASFSGKDAKGERKFGSGCFSLEKVAHARSPQEKPLDTPIGAFCIRCPAEPDFIVNTASCHRNLPEKTLAASREKKKNQALGLDLGNDVHESREIVIVQCVS